MPFFSIKKLDPQVDILDADGNVVGKRTQYGFAKCLRDALPCASFTDTGEKLNILIGAANYAAAPTLKDRFLSEVNALSKAHSLAVPHPEANAASELISFFQAIQSSLRKLDGSDNSITHQEIETAIRQVVDNAR